jgi:hypothetical protein
MDPQELVWKLLGDGDEAMCEATVRLPPRSHRWVAVYTGVEPGTQITRSTGLTDRSAALAQAREWEVQASAERSRRKAEGTWGIGPLGRQNAYLTQAEIAAILGISERAVRAIERRALRKLRQHPLLRSVWAEFSDRYSVEEDSIDLEPEEIGALFGLVRTDFERRVLLKVLVFIWADS